MTGDCELREKELTPGLIFAVLRDHGWTLKGAGAVFGLCGGMSAAVLGSAFTGLTWFTGLLRHGYLHSSGTVLLFLTIPLLVFGAHCLDLLDTK